MSFILTLGAFISSNASELRNRDNDKTEMCEQCFGSKEICFDCGKPYIKTPCECGCAITASCMNCMDKHSLKMQKSLLLRAIGDAFKYIGKDWVSSDDQAIRYSQGA